jgi:putative tricarboxylic transport membrane protein
MTVFDSLILGLKVSLDPANLAFCFIGVLVGTLIGVLPGIGPVGTISILLPIIAKLTPVSAIIMLAGVYYGCQYGGSTTSILVNIPGEASSVITCLEGYQMACQGRAGPALGIAAIGSFIAGTCGVLGLSILALPLSEFALKFGPAEYFSLMVLAIIMLTYLAQGSMIKALMMAALGLILSSIGMDIVTGDLRFTFDLLGLSDGIGLVPLVMGLFGLSEVLLNVEKAASKEILETKIKNLWPTWKDWARAKWAIGRGTFIGFLLGVLPGAGPVISTFISYTVEKRLSKEPEKFGTGMIEGVAGPESANNAATQASFVPLLTLGIPPNPTTAVLLGAFMIFGLQPGPLLLQNHPDFFWGIVGSMYIGNVMLIVLNLPLIPLWVQVLRMPYHILFPLIILFCLIGSYSLNNYIFDVYVMIIFGIIGYLMRKYKYEGAPLVMTFVLGPLMELALRRSLILSGGSFSIFWTRPISAIILSLALGVVFLSIGMNLRAKKSSHAQNQ